MSPNHEPPSKDSDEKLERESCNGARNLLKTRAIVRETSQCKAWAFAQELLMHLAAQRSGPKPAPATPKRSVNRAAVKVFE